MLDRCAAPWHRQRPKSGLLSPAERAQMAPLVALALRRTTAGAVVELLTDRVASAHSLAAVCVTRLWQFVTSTAEHGWREVVTVPIDEHGHRAEQQRATRAAAAATASTREAVLAEWRPRLAAAAAAADTTSQVEQRRRAHPRTRYGTPARITEPEEIFRRDYPHPDDADQDHAQARRERIHQAARLRAARERAAHRRHPGE